MVQPSFNSTPSGLVGNIISYVYISKLLLCCPASSEICYIHEHILFKPSQIATQAVNLFLKICWDKTRWAQQHNLVIIWWWLDSDTIKWCLSCSTINSLKMLNNAYRLAVLFTLNYVDVPSTTICLMYEHYFYIQLFKNQLMWQGVWNHKALCLLSFFNHHISRYI